MTVAMQSVREVYGRLASILQRPEVFGLGPQTPQALADAIEGVLITLGQIDFEHDRPSAEENLEEELSQDADRDPVPTY